MVTTIITILILIPAALIFWFCVFSGDVLEMAGRGTVITPKCDHSAVDTEESYLSPPCQDEGMPTSIKTLNLTNFQMSTQEACG